MPDYKFKEKDILNEVMDYIDNTYRQHYANGVEKQATEIIIDQGHGEGFCMGNILKYAQRYGKKRGKNKTDLFNSYTLCCNTNITEPLQVFRRCFRSQL